MPPIAREILAYLIEQSDFHGVSQVTIEEIAHAVESCDRTVQRYLGMLRNKHWIWISYIKIGPKKNEPNVYRLLMNGEPWQRGESLTKHRHPSSRPSGNERRRDPREKRPRRDEHADWDAEGRAQAAGDRGSAPEENGNTVDVGSPQEASETRGTPPPPSADADPDADLDRIAPRTPYVPPTRPHVRPVRVTFAEQIHASLIHHGFGALAGDGLAVRLSRMFMARSIHAQAPVDHLLNVLAAKRQESLLTAGDGPSPWKGEIDAQRAYLFVALRKMQLPEHEPKRPASMRLTSIWREPPARRVDEPLVREHESTMAFVVSKKIGGEIAQKIHDAIVATYHGIQPLKDLDAVTLANRLQHRCIETGTGGTLHVADVVGTIQLFATYQAFKQLRNEVTPPAALESFFMAEMKKIVRGCGAQKAAQAASAKPFKSSSTPNRQPGTETNHVHKKPNEATPEQMFEIFERMKGQKP